MSGRISQHDSGLKLENLRIEAANFKSGYVEAVLEAAYFIEDDKVFIESPKWTRIRAQYASPQDKRKRLNIPLAGDLLAKILEKIGVKKKARGRGCGCAKRQRKLNTLDARFRSWINRGLRYGRQLLVG